MLLLSKDLILLLHEPSLRESLANEHRRESTVNSVSLKDVTEAKLTLSLVTRCNHCGGSYSFELKIKAFNERFSQAGEIYQISKHEVAMSEDFYKEYLSESFSIKDMIMLNKRDPNTAFKISRRKGGRVG